MDTTQLTFLLYLLLGQAALVGLWLFAAGLAAPAAEGEEAPSRPARGSLAFAAYLLLGQVALLAGWNALAAAWEAAGAVARADAVVVLHFGFMVFILAVQLCVLLGWPLGWQWTRNFWLRLAQVVCIEIVAGQDLVDLECPLTSIERELRGSVRPSQPGDAALTDSERERARLHYLEGASPLARFAHGKLFYPIPADQYVWVAGGFVAAVLLTWLAVPPRMPVSPRLRGRWPRTGPGSAPAPPPGPGRTGRPTAAS